MSLLCSGIILKKFQTVISVIERLIQILFGLLSTSGCPNETYSQIFPWWSRIRKDQFNMRYLSFKERFDIEQLFLKGDWSNQSSHLYILLVKGISDYFDDFSFGGINLLLGPNNGDLFVFFMDLIERMVYLLKWGLSTDPNFC